MIATGVEIDQQALLAAFVRLGGLYEDLSPVFEEVGEEALKDIRRRLDNHPGPALKMATIKKKGHARILRDSDNLYGSFVKGARGNVTRITRTEGEVGTDVEYASFHQTGTPRMARRTVVQITGEQEAKYCQIASAVQLRRIRELGFEAR